MARLVIPPSKFVKKTPEERREERKLESINNRLLADIIRLKKDRELAFLAFGNRVNRELSFAKNIKALVERLEELEHELDSLRQGGAVPQPGLHDALGRGEASQTNREGDQS